MIHTQKLETYIYAHSLVTEDGCGCFAAEKSRKRIRCSYLPPFDRPKCRSKCDHHTISVFAHCGFFKLNAVVDDDWDLMLAELFIFHRGKIGVGLWRGYRTLYGRDAPDGFGCLA